MIKWKNQQKNAYPDIILADSVIDNLRVDNKNIILNLERRGFAIKCNNGLYYTKSAQVIIEDCDIENILVRCIYKKKFGKMINVVMDIGANELFYNISSKKWRYEIVEEYYSEMGVFFIGRIVSDTKHTVVKKSACRDILYQNMHFLFFSMFPELAAFWQCLRPGKICFQ